MFNLNVLTVTLHCLYPLERQYPHLNCITCSYLNCLGFLSKVYCVKKTLVSYYWIYAQKKANNTYLIPL